MSVVASTPVLFGLSFLSFDRFSQPVLPSSSFFVVGAYLSLPSFFYLVLVTPSIFALAYVLLFDFVCYSGRSFQDDSCPSGIKNQENIRFR